MPETLTLREITERYPDEWVCVEETEWDGADQPVAGRVIAHGTNRDDAMRAGDDFRTAHPDSVLFRYYTGPLIPEGLALILVTR